MRSMMEFDSPVVLEYLVGHRLVGLERVRSKELAIINKLSLIEEWKGKEEPHNLSLILKSLVIRMMLSMLTSVSLRYFKAECNESE